jgi:DNA-binding NarL/FixJ family response regulator
LPERLSALGELIQVGLLSPSEAVRTGLRSMLSADDRLEVVLEGSTLADLTARGDKDADVVILTPAALRGLNFQREMQHAAEIGVLWLIDGLPEEHFEPQHLPGQPWGVLPLEVDSGRLRAAVRALYEGLSVAPPDWLGQQVRSSVEKLDDEWEGGEELTPREVEVLQQLALGLTNKQIAVVLGISEHTVKFHISSIYSKLGVMNRAEAVRVGVRRGWISI